MTNQISPPKHNPLQPEPCQKKSAWKLVVGALLCCGLWGSAPPFIKFGYELMNIRSTPDILLFAGLRFFLAGVLVLLFALLQKKKIPCATAGMGIPIMVLALFQTFGQYLFYYLGLARTSSVMGSVLSGTSAFIALLLSVYVFRREKASLNKLAGCLLGFLGIVVMNMDGLSFVFGAGEWLLLGSQVCSAMSAVFLQIFSQKYDPVLLSGYQFCLGGLVLAGCGMAAGGQIVWNLPGFLVLIWLAFVSAGAYTLWGILLRDYPVSSVSVFGCTIPVFGVLFSWLLLHESQAFTWQTLAALLLIAAGIAILNGFQAKKKAKADQPS